MLVESRQQEINIGRSHSRAKRCHEHRSLSGVIMKIAIYNPMLTDDRWVVGSFRAEETCRALSESGIGGIVASPFIKSDYQISSTFRAIRVPENPVLRCSAFLRIVRSGDFDIVQERIYSGGVVLNGCGLFASIFQGIPLVIELHNIGTPTSMLKRLPIYFGSMWYCSLVLSYTDVTGFMGLGVSKKKIVEVPNGYSSQLINAVMNEGMKETRYEQLFGTRRAFGFFGGLSEDKGVDIVLEAAERLSSDPDICFLFAGKGPLEPEIKRLSKRQNSNIAFLGLLNRGDTITAMSRCRATISLSNAWSSRMGNPVKVVESLALGVAPIVNSDCSIPDGLKKHCLLMPDRDSETLVKMVRRLSMEEADGLVPSDIESYSLESIARRVLVPAYDELTR